MTLLDWILVGFGAVVAVAGGWIQLHPERVLPDVDGVRQNADSPADLGALSQIRLLGSCVMFMGAFFALQMAADLARIPWWVGTFGGLVVAIASVRKVNSRVRQQWRASYSTVEETSLTDKFLEPR